MSKFKLTKESKELLCGTKVYRIELLIDTLWGKKGDKGGFVESENNLSQSGDAWVFGDAEVFGDARVSGNARVSAKNDIIAFQYVGSEDGTLTAFRQKDGSIFCRRGCFSGTLAEFKEAVKYTHKSNMFAKQYKLAIQMIELKLGANND